MFDDNVERAILYFLIFENEELNLSREDFAVEKNKQIYLAVNELKNKAEEINAISIKNKINGKPASILKYISDLAEFKYRTGLEYSYSELKRLSKKRKLSKVSKELETDLKKNNIENIDIYIEEKIKELNEIENEDTKEETIAEAITETIAIIEEKMHKKYDYKYWTGIFDLDEVTNGLHKEELTIIGARPGVGKSTFAIQIAEKIAKNGIRVGYVSLEMSKTQIIQKLLSRITRIDSKKIRSGILDEEEAEKIGFASIELSDLNIDITTNARSIQDIEIYARRKRNKEDLGLLVIDYLQLVTNKEKTNNREQEVASITRSLKLLSLELKIPILALSQMRRESTKTEPNLADLRESGAIEQDADNVIFLYKEEDTEEKKLVEDIYVDLQKQRAGGLIKTKVRFDKKVSIFTNLTVRK